MKSALFLYRPIIGKTKSSIHLFEAFSFFSKNGYSLSTYVSYTTGDFYNFLQRDVREYEMIVCSGGEGILNEVISGILDYSLDCRLAYLPTGLSKGFERSLGISVTLEDSVQFICKGNSKRIDIGKINQKYFAHVAAFGNFIAVLNQTPWLSNSVLHYLVYILEGIKQLSSLKSFHIKLYTKDLFIENDFLMGVILNTSYIAGLNNPFSSYAKVDDGIFEVILIKMPEKIVDIQEIIMALLNENTKSEKVIFFQTSCLYLQSELMAWTIDGEPGGKYKVVYIDNLRECISLCC